MLTDTQVRKVKSREKSFKLADGKGLFLVVQPNGSKYWRFRYQFAAIFHQFFISTDQRMMLARTFRAQMYFSCL